MIFNILLKLFLLTIVLGAPTALVEPSQDSFYEPPTGYEDLPLGTILKHRNAPAPIRSIVFEVNLQNTWQLLVRSEDSFGNPNAIVTTVFQPYNADPSKLISYQVAQDSANINCSPSYAFMDGGLILNVVAEAEMILIQTALNEGYYVVSPDYEGPKSVFTGGIQAAHAVLDSLRAVFKSSNITGLNSDADTVLWGYSGGSLASGWAAALQPNYAPELLPNLKGVAVGGWVTNITATVTAEPIVNGGIFAGLGANGIAGLSNEYPELYEYLKTAMYEDKYTKFAQAYDICLVQSVLTFPFNNYFEGPDRYFKDGIAVLTEPTIGDILTNNTLGLIPENMPAIPVFAYHGKLDAIVPYDQAIRVYDTWCAAGIESLEFNSDDTAGHITEVIQGSGAAFAWIQKILNGGTPISGCQDTSRITNLLYPGSVLALTNLLQALFVNVLGLSIGPNGENLVVTNGQLISKFNVSSIF